jgi:hypothetical protein
MPNNESNGGKSEQTLKSGARDVMALRESMNTLAETQGEMLRRFIMHEQALARVQSALTTLYNELTKRNAICDARHEDIDSKFDSMSDADVLEADTSVFELMTGREVKKLLAEEKKHREALQAQVDDMRERDKEHRIQREAVQKAKAEWEEKQTALEDERSKLKIARYGIYGAITVAFISAVATVTVAILSQGGG